MIFILKLLMLMMCFSEACLSAGFFTIYDNLAVVNKNISGYSDTQEDSFPARDADSTVAGADDSLLDAYSDAAYIKFFENYVIKRKIVTSLSEKTLNEIANRYSVRPDRLKVLLCLQYALESIGKSYTVPELAEMSDGELMGQALSYYSVFWGGLTKEEKADVKAAYEKTKQEIKAKNKND